MASRIYTANNFSKPGGGIVNGLRPHLVQQDEMAFSLNMRLASGNWVKRGGTVAQGSAAAAAKVTWLFHAYDTTGGSLVVRMAMISTVLYYRIGSGAWTSFKTGLTAGTYPSAVAYQDKVYWTNGVDTPQVITIANPPVASNWTTLPTGIIPSWVVLQKNRIYYGGDTSTPNLVYFTDFGTPATTQTTNFYQVPDDQNGNYPKAACNIGDGIGLFCQDFLVYLTGVGPLTHQLFHMPRGSACVARRSVVDMGEFGAYFLTERGIFSWDGNSPPIPVDPFGRINWSDIDMTTEDNIWAMRVGDEYRIYYKSKGDTSATTASAADVLASSTARTRMTILYWALTRITAVPFTTSGTIGYYLAYDCRLKQWSLHTGNHLCGAWTQYRYGDTQDPWVGSAAADGLVFMADQISAFTDNAVSIVCYLKTGSLVWNERAKVTRVKAQFGVVRSGDAKVRICVWQNGLQGEPDPPAAEATASLALTSAPGGADTYNMPGNWLDFVPVDEDLAYTGEVGYDPQLEYTFVANTAFEFRGHKIYVEIEED